jgi:hypothetical protein
MYLLCCSYGFFFHFYRLLNGTVSNLGQGWTNSGRQVAVVTERCTVALHTFVSSIWEFGFVTLLAPRSVWWLLDF